MDSPGEELFREFRRVLEEGLEEEGVLEVELEGVLWGLVREPLGLGMRCGLYLLLFPPEPGGAGCRLADWGWMRLFKDFLSEDVGWELEEGMLEEEGGPWVKEKPIVGGCEEGGGVFE